MAYFDHEAARVYKERKEAYDDLKSELKWKETSNGAERTFDDHFNNLNVTNAGRAYEYLENQEQRMKELEDRIAEYNKFFLLLRDLTPRHHSIHDIIG